MPRPPDLSRSPAPITSQSSIRSTPPGRLCSTNLQRCCDMLVRRHDLRLYKGVMISSTFTDLKEHRAALSEAIERQGFKDVVMENDTAKADVDCNRFLSPDGSRRIGLYRGHRPQIWADTACPRIAIPTSFRSRNSSSMRPSGWSGRSCFSSWETTTRCALRTSKPTPARLPS